MPKDTLKDFYEQRYSFERNSSTLAPIKVVAIPTTRFEAAIRYFPQHFRGGDILEIGAGNGNVAKTLLMSNLNIKHYTLSDLSLARVEGIRKNLDDNRVVVQEMDAEEISEGEHDKYDAIIMIALIEHLVDPLGTMRRVRSLLKPGGFVYIDTPNIARYTQRIKLLLGRFPSTSTNNEGLTQYSGEPADLYDEGHLHYFTFRSLSLMLTERCGYSRVTKLKYPGGTTVFGKHIHYILAILWPGLFSELALLAHY